MPGARLALIGVVLGLMGAAPAPDPVEYRLKPILVNGALDHLAVELSLTGDADGVTDVRLPDEWAGYTRLHEALSGFAASGAQMSRPSPALIRLTHKPSERVSLSYQVRDGRGSVAGADYRPDVDPNGFLLLGEAGIAWPTGRLSGPARVRLAAAPAGWSLASTLETARTVATVRESVSVGGADVRVVTRQADGAPVHVALRGSVDFMDARGGDAEGLADTFAGVLKAQREMLGAEPRPFVAVIQSRPTEGAAYSREGLGRGDGAAFFLSSSNNNLWLSLRVIAHEPVHAWLPREIGGLPSRAAEPGAYWFSEGFADFVALRSLVKAGEWSPENYAGLLNGYVDPDTLRSAPTVSKAEMVSGYGRRRELFQRPYHQGLALALLWDSRLRVATNGQRGVDDVLKAMRARAGEGRSADVLFPLVYRQLGGGDLSAEIDAHVEKGRPVVLPRSLYDGCLQAGPRSALGAEGDLFVREGWRLAQPRDAAAYPRCLRLMFGPGAIAPSANRPLIS